MTELEVEIAYCLARVRFGFNNYDRRFAQGLAQHTQNDHKKPLTAAQSAYAKQLVTKYRTQIPADLVEKVTRPTAA
jgi:hypothetical protein